MERGEVVGRSGGDGLDPERAWSDERSSGAATATVSRPSSRHVRNTRSAISPRFATSSRRIGTAALYAGGAIGSEP